LGVNLSGFLEVTFGLLNPFIQAFIGFCLDDEDSLRILKQRYAKGEITKKQYSDMKKELTEDGAAPASSVVGKSESGYAKNASKPPTTSGSKVVKWVSRTFFALFLLFLALLIIGGLYRSVSNNQNTYPTTSIYAVASPYGNASSHNQSSLNPSSTSTSTSIITTVHAPVALYSTYLQITNYYPDQVVKYSVMDLSTNQTYNATYAIAIGGTGTIALLIPDNDAYKLTIYTAGGDNVWWNKVYLNVGGTASVVLRAGYYYSIDSAPPNLCATDGRSLTSEAYSTVAGLECSGSVPPNTDS
jgi:hypothetical protein